MSGKAAALGSRMMGPVADQMLKQFAANFATRLQATASAQTTTTPAASPVSTSAPVAAHAPSSELNGFALAWAVMREWLRGIFARKSV